MNYDLNSKEGMANAKRWTLATLSMVRDGGVWAVPRTASVYVVDHKAKTLTRSGMKPDPSINKVAAAIGWRVIERNTPTWPL
jgi:hypothetical protein